MAEENITKEEELKEKKEKERAIRYEDEMAFVISYVCSIKMKGLLSEWSLLLNSISSIPTNKSSSFLNEEDSLCNLLKKNNL